MKQILFIFTFILVYYQSNACYCETIWGSINTAKDVAEFDFVALVRVKDILKEEEKNDSNNFFKINIETIESFKGSKTTKEITVIGNHYEISGAVTSCDLGMKINGRMANFRKHN